MTDREILSSPLDQHSRGSPDRLLIDSLQLLRMAYKRSIREKRSTTITTVDGQVEQASAQFSWLLGDAANTVPPLLLQVTVLRDAVDSNQFAAHFLRHNIVIQFDSPTQWVDERDGTRFTFGALLLFALMDQTIGSHSMAPLGTFTSTALRLNRQALVPVLQDTQEQSDPSFYSPRNYDASVLTPISRIDEAMPIVVDTPMMLCSLFKMSSSDAKEKNVFVSNNVTRGQDDLLHRVDARYCVPRCNPFRPTILCRSQSRIPPFTTNSVLSTAQPSKHSDALSGALSLYSSHTVDTRYSSARSFLVDSLIPSVELNLLRPNTLIKVDRPFSHSLIRLFRETNFEIEAKGAKMSGLGLLTIKTSELHPSKRQRVSTEQQQRLDLPVHRMTTQTVNPQACHRESRFDQLPLSETIPDDPMVTYTVRSPFSHNTTDASASRQSIRGIPFPVTDRNLRPDNKRRSESQARPPRSLYETLTLRKWKPLIIVPSSFSSSLVRLDNAKEFLDHRRLVRATLSQQSVSAHSDKHHHHHHHHPLGENFRWKTTTTEIGLHSSSLSPSSGRYLPSSTHSVPIEFKVVGDAEITRFGMNDWFRVVAVVVQGPQWQFQHWPFSNLRDVFTCIRGVYFAYEGETQLPAIVHSYPVEVLRIKRNTRHADGTAWKQFVLTLADILQKPRDFRQFDRTKFKK